MDKNTFIKLGKLITQGREKLGFTQKQLAVKVSISSSTLSKIEHGTTNPSVFTVYKLGKLLKIDLFKVLD
jgi:transcriptional regulator with XRE-family HTH domain